MLPAVPYLKLGKRAPKFDKRTLKMSKYITPALAPAPVSCDWTQRKVNWGMMLNDSLGDCTIAACAHAIQVWSLCNPAGLAVGQTEITVVDSDILKMYEKSCGYNPSDPATDEGGVELDVLNFWRHNPLHGHHLKAYAEPDPGNFQHIKQSIWLFGGVYIGLALPITAQSQDVWDVVGDPLNDPDSMPGSWGGHAVYVPAYDSAGLTMITWGQLKRMTKAFWNAYCDESHALVGGWWVRDRATPSGFDYATMINDLAGITG